MIELTEYEAKIPDAIGKKLARSDSYLAERLRDAAVMGLLYGAKTFDPSKGKRSYYLYHYAYSKAVNLLKLLKLGKRKHPWLEKTYGIGVIKDNPYWSPIEYITDNYNYNKCEVKDEAKWLLSTTSTLHKRCLELWMRGESLRDIGKKVSLHHSCVDSIIKHCLETFKNLIMREDSR